MTDTEIQAHWQRLAAQWAKYAPPLIPTAADIDDYRAGLAGHDENVLLLGVTPQLAVLGQKLTAVDFSAEMIRYVWPGDSDRRQAVLGNWLHDLPRGAGFTAVITDGGTLCLEWRDQYERLFDQLHASCAPGFRLVTRCHLPENLRPGPEIAKLQAVLARGEALDPEIAKHCLAHALVAETGEPNVMIRDIARAALDLFDGRLDQSQLASLERQLTVTGSHSFPTRALLCDLFEDCGITLDPGTREGSSAVICGTAR